MYNLSITVVFYIMQTKTNGYGRKTDKYTQSPLLKIFKDIMQRENTDPEKINLLKDKNSERNQRKYSGSAVKSKSDKTNKTETIFSNKENQAIAKQAVYNVEKESRSRTHSFPIRNEKKESWWLWNEADSSDRCSCVSCTIKKIAKSEKVGYFCLAVLFAVSVAVVFVFILPLLGCEKMNTLGGFKKSDSMMDSEVFSKKIDLLKDSRGKRNHRGGAVAARLSGSSAISGQDSAERNLQESMDQSDAEATLSPELSNIIDMDKINNDSSEKLRNFFKKLLTTEAKIKKLKTTLNDAPQISSIHSNFMEPDIARTKRSLKSIDKPVIRKKTNVYESTTDLNLSKFSLFYPPYISIAKPKSKVRHKRNNKTEPTGFVLEKQQLLIQYKPNNKKVIPKCSHTPKESNSHEHEIKHPFYKNSQRLDELLDNFFNKNFRDIIIGQPFFNNDFENKTKEKCKHNKYPKNDYLHENKNENNIIYQNENANMETLGNENLIMDYSTIDPFTTEMEVSTNFPNDVDNYKIDDHRDEKSPFARKLMQIDVKQNNEDSSNDDIEPLFNNDSANKDDKLHDRIKRVDETSNDRMQTLNKKYIAPSLHSSNWKGPMPLYPDEINFMIKQAAVRAVNKISLPVNSKDIPSEFDDTEEELKDLDSFEDYVSGKYDKIVKMAQAYSDYGVLNTKKWGNEKSNVSRNDHRVRLSPDKVRSSFFNRLKDFSPSNNEAIVSETIPENANDDAGLNLLSQFLRKHIKFSNSTKGTITESPYFRSVDYLNMLQSNKFKTDPYLIDFKITTKDPQKLLIRRESTENSTNVDDIEIIKSTEKIPNDNKDSSDDTIIFTARKFKRSLKSIDETFETNKDNTSDNDDGINILNTINGQIKIHDNLKNKSNQNETIKEDSTPLDFLSMLANIFSTFAGIPSDNSTGGIIYPKIISNLFEYTNTISTTEVMYPMYDADMIDNIGHRSRVLLSFENTNNNGSNIKSVIEDKIENTTEMNLQNKISTTNSSDADASKSDEKRNINKTKAIVKRNAQDSNLIPWNNIYDDEYGVKYDLMDKIGRNKHSEKYSNLVNKSKKWFKNKTKKLTLTNEKKKKKAKKRKQRDVVSFGLDGDNFESYDDGKIYSNFVSEDNKSFREENSRKSSFTRLNPKMEEYFQKAAEAFRDTKNFKTVREEIKEDQVASSLMQQLVRMMNDVVDYQVHQKTCLKLPENLSVFLKWLTAPGDENDGGRLKIQLHDEISDDYQQTDATSDQRTLFNNKEKELHQDPRVEGENAISTLQDLIIDFDQLNDYDKINMIGVKEYLQNQLYFLLRHLRPESYDIYNTFMPESLRFRRSARPKNIPPKRTNRKMGRRKRKLDKFIKNFNKKHTKTTASFIDSMNEFTEPAFDGSLKVASQNGATALIQNGGCDDKANNGYTIKKPMRNLQDVYYKALAEAKKVTTIKT